MPPQTICHVSPVTCHMSPVTSDLSPVMCHLSTVKYEEKKLEKKIIIIILQQKLEKVVELIGGGSAINRLYPDQFMEELLSLVALGKGRSALPQDFSAVTFFKETYFFRKSIMRIITFMYYTLCQTLKKFLFQPYFNFVSVSVSLTGA